MSEYVRTTECPLCGIEPAEVSWQTANHQEVCGNEDCPVNTWDPTVWWVNFECIDCGKEVSREQHQIDIEGIQPKRCGSCTLERMAEP